MARLCSRLGRQSWVGSIFDFPHAPYAPLPPTFVVLEMLEAPLLPPHRPGDDSVSSLAMCMVVRVMHSPKVDPLHTARMSCAEEGILQPGLLRRRSVCSDHRDLVIEAEPTYPVDAFNSPYLA